MINGEWDHIGNDPLARDGAEVLAYPDLVHIPLDLFFIQLKEFHTLAVDVAVNEYVFNIVDATGIVVGDWLGIFSSDTTNQFYFGEVLAVVGNAVTMDRPFDFAFEAGDTLVNTTRELNVDGSVTPSVFVVQGPGNVSGQAVDIIRIMIQITCDSLPDFGKFGDISGGLTKGIVLRINNGITKNIWNVKTNYEFANLAYDLAIYDRANPAEGVFGLACRYTFGGRDKHGTVVRIFPGQSLELWVQDDLTSLLSFRIIAEGRLVKTADRPEIAGI